MNFRGELKKIIPVRLIRNEKKDELADFFLVLGIFYNDLKNLLYYLIQAENQFKNIKKEISVELGEYVGVKTHLERLIAATIHEFFNFLHKNKNNLKTAEFNLIYCELNKNLKSRWDLLIEIADGNNIEQTTSFGKVLLLIRNNVAYHLSSKEIRKGFIDFFHNDAKNKGNEFAYYSIGDNMENTRFYYCDAAVGRAVRSEIDRAGKIKYEEYVSNLKNVIEHMNFTLAALLREHLRQRPYL